MTALILAAEFPRIPTGIMKRHITDEADNQLAIYLPLTEDQHTLAGVELSPRPQLPSGVVDTPLVRVFNFLRMYFPCPLLPVHY